MSNTEYEPQRRALLKTLGGIGAALSLGACVSPAGSSNGNPTAAQSSRPSGQRYMGGFAAAKIEKPRIAVIGAGQRGVTLLPRLARVPGCEIVGICDLHAERASEGDRLVRQHGHNPRLYSGDPQRWRTMLTELRPDAVLVITPWELHAPMAIAAMEGGAHAFVEVPLAENIREIWDIINTSERTGKHCMMMENCNYGREELLYLNMVRQKLIGDLLHGEASYIHELRFQMENQDSTGSWRTYKYAQRNANLYPTHGLGPVAQYMNIARRDDNLSRIVSMASPALTRQQYAQTSTKLTDPKFRDLRFVAGDVSTSILKTSLGRTIMLQWDENTPRPYSRHNFIQGTKGALAGYPKRMAIEGLTKSYHQWAEKDAWEALAAQYEHPLWKRLGATAQKVGGHGGMDYIMLVRMVECLQQGTPLDQNIYEGALWSSVVELSGRSVAEGGMPQDFPDFTRGQWKNTEPLAIVA